MTALIIISCLIIGAIGGAWWQHHRDVKDKRILANQNIDLMDIHESYIAQIKKEQDAKNSFQEGCVSLWHDNHKLMKENESLRFQIQQYNIDKTDGEQPETKG